MLKNLIFIILVNLLLTFNVFAGTISGMKIRPGITNGIMDIALDVSFYFRYLKYNTISPEFITSISVYKSTKNKFSSIVDMQTISVYALCKHYFIYKSKILPYISLGPGLHYIISFSDASSSVGEHGFSKDWRHAITLKAHALFGCEIDFSKNLFLSIDSRVTYPSDIILDSVFLGLGIKFNY